MKLTFDALFSETRSNVLKRLLTEAEDVTKHYISAAAGVDLSGKLAKGKRMCLGTKGIRFVLSTQQRFFYQPVQCQSNSVVVHLSLLVGRGTWAPRSPASIYPSSILIQVSWASRVVSCGRCGSEMLLYESLHTRIVVLWHSIGQHGDPFILRKLVLAHKFTLFEVILIQNGNPNAL